MNCSTDTWHRHTTYRYGWQTYSNDSNMECNTT